jgi:hypothetical protein
VAFLDMEGRVPKRGSPLLGLLRRWLPKDRWGDELFSLAKFLKRNRHWPRKVQGDFNDFLYRLKVSREIDAPLRSLVTCKLGLRDHVRQVLGEAYCVPLTAVLETREQVLGYAFPSRCVIKPSHLSGEVLLRKAGEELDLARIASWLRRDYYLQSRERNYRSVKPRVLVEPYLALDGELDLKVQCIRGEPKVIAAFQDVPGKNLRYRFTPDWRLLYVDFGIHAEGAAATLPRPECLEEVLRLARILSKDFFFIRVDLMAVQGRIYVGELTSIPGSASIRQGERLGWKGYNRVIFGEKGYNLADFPELAS